MAFGKNVGAPPGNSQRIERMVIELTDPIRVAAWMLLAKVEQLPVTGYGGNCQEGAGVLWVIHGRSNIYHLLIAPDGVTLFDVFLGDGRRLTRQLFDDIQVEVADRTNLDVAAMFDAFNGQTRRPAAHVTRTEVTEMMTLAQTLPLARIADALCARLQQPQKALRVHALSRDNKGYAVWLLGAEHNDYIIRQRDDVWYLTDFDSRAYATVSAAELEDTAPYRH